MYSQVDIIILNKMIIFFNIKAKEKKRYTKHIKAELPVGQQKQTD